MKLLKHNVAALAVFGLLICFKHAVAGDPSVEFNFTSASQIDTSQFATRDPKHPFYFDLLHGPENTLSHRTRTPFTVDIGTDFKAWLSDRIPPGRNQFGARSLAIQIISQVNENVKDKIFFDPVPHASVEHIDIDAKDTLHYLSYSFMLDESYTVPHNWLIHMQAWQCCGGHPPFTMSVSTGSDPKGPVEVTFGLRDDFVETEENGREQILYRTTVQRGEWINIGLALEPRADGDKRAGSATMWWNGVEKFSYRGFWGYRPGGHPVDGHEVLPYIGIDLGTYRRRQKGSQIVYFDNIRYGTDMKSVLGLTSAPTELGGVPGGVHSGRH